MRLHRHLALCLLLVSTAAVASGADLRLIQAVKNSDAVAARALVQQGVDVNGRADDGTTALHWAVFRNNEDLVALLIQKGAQPNTQTDLGVTPLWLACTNSSTSIIGMLLKAAANPNLTAATNGTPLMVAARRGNLEAVQLLLSHHADVNGNEAFGEQTALMWAVAEHHPDVVRALLQAKADVGARSKTTKRYALICCQDYEGDGEGATEILEGGYTALLFAAQEGDIESARLLLAAGANVNDESPMGTSTLVVAAQNGQRAFAQVVLDAGADSNGDRGGYTALHAAVVRNDVELVKSLLAHGANPNARQRNGSPTKRVGGAFALDKLMVGATPFLLATRSSALEIMRVLAANGADVTIGLEDATSPIMAASDRIRGIRVTEPRALQAIKLAVQLGVKVTVANADGDTALHIAATRRSDSIIEFLAASGAALDVKNKRGETPLMIALMAPPPAKGAGQATFDEYDHLLKGGPTTAALLRKLGAKE